MSAPRRSHIWLTVRVPLDSCGFMCQKIIRSVVNGTRVFAIWIKKIILFSLRSLSGLSSIPALPCLFKILRLRDQLFFWSVSFPSSSDSSSLSSTDAGLFTNDEGRQGTEMLFFSLWKIILTSKLCLKLVVLWINDANLVVSFAYAHCLLEWSSVLLLIFVPAV